MAAKWVAFVIFFFWGGRVIKEQIWSATQVWWGCYVPEFCVFTSDTGDELMTEKLRTDLTRKDHIAHETVEMNQL